jgi:bacterioferritin (cytochrome b1)
MPDKNDGGASGIIKSKLKDILSYMKDHNREHAHELHGLLDAIKELDADEILDLIENGARSIEEAADQIEQALEVLEEL